MRLANIYRAEEIQSMKTEQDSGNPDDGWKLSRPEGVYGLLLLSRVKRAWMVFIGRADVLIFYPTQKQ